MPKIIQMKKPGNRRGRDASKGENRNFRKKRNDNYRSPKGKTSKSQTGSSDLIRLNKYVANSGVCSRREADVYIAAGNVTVNGETITEMGYKVKLGDVVKFDGRLLNPEKKEYVLLNKPKNFITTTSDEKGRRTVMELVSNASKARLVPVGRLDRNTTGLLLFTNDGDLAKKLTHPKHGVRKIYHVELNKNLKAEDLKKIQSGLTLEDGPVQVDEASYIANAPKKRSGHQNS